MVRRQAALRTGDPTPDRVPRLTGQRRRADTHDVIAEGSGAASPTRVFIPEAHGPRDLRLLLDPSGIAYEDGTGLRRTFAWADCEAVLLFGDRAELVMDAQTSVVLRSADWYQGDDLLRAVRRVVPLSQLLDFGRSPEPADPTPYRLSGLATWSSAVLLTGAVSCLLLALMGISIGVSDGRGSAVALGLAFALPMPFLLIAMARRLAVPREWRARAAVAGATRVRVDATLAVLPAWSLPWIALALAAFIVSNFVAFWRGAANLGILNYAAFPLLTLVLVEWGRRGSR